MNLFVYNDRNYIITVDNYSGVWEVDYLKNTQKRTVIRKLKAHTAIYGIPSTLWSHNGAQYRAKKFKIFSTRLLPQGAHKIMGRQNQLVRQLEN